jgi:sugar-specific transcriptional regulator TrmB
MSQEYSKSTKNLEPSCFFPLLFSAIYKKSHKSLNTIQHFSLSARVKMIEGLKRLGLNYYESKVLEVLLKEKLSLQELSKKAEIPFGKVYSVVKGLKGKKVVMETNSRPKLVYVENASDIIARLIKEKQEKEKSNLEKLREIATEIDKLNKRETKFFQIGTTVEENREIQLRTFIEAEDE